MVKNFIFNICGECNAPLEIVEVCNVLGYNAFPGTNFHGELSYKETVELRQTLIDKLKEEGKHEEARHIENGTVVLTVTFDTEQIKALNIKH